MVLFIVLFSVSYLAMASKRRFTVKDVIEQLDFSDSNSDLIGDLESVDDGNDVDLWQLKKINFLRNLPSTVLV